MLRLAIATNIFKNKNCAINNHASKYLTANLRYLSSTQPNLSVHLTQPKEDTKTEIIYYGPLTPQIRAVKIFSLSSSTAGLLAQPIILREANTIGSTGLLIAICSVVGFFTFITPLLLHLITKKYVTEIRYDSDTSTYYATTITFFLAKKQVSLALKLNFIIYIGSSVLTVTISLFYFSALS